MQSSQLMMEQIHVLHLVKFMHITMILQQQQQLIT